jgi:hypothetical protein
MTPLEYLVYIPRVKNQFHGMRFCRLSDVVNCMVELYTVPQTTILRAREIAKSRWKVQKSTRGRLQPMAQIIEGGTVAML